MLHIQNSWLLSVAIEEQLSCKRSWEPQGSLDYGNGESKLSP